MSPPRGEELDDRTLVERCLADDEGAFRILVERYQSDVYATAFRIVPRAEDAEDLTQETFLRAFRALKRYDPARPFGAWLHTIATRLVAHASNSRATPSTRR